MAFSRWHKQLTDKAGARFSTVAIVAWGVVSAADACVALLPAVLLRFWLGPCTRHDHLCKTLLKHTEHALEQIRDRKRGNTGTRDGGAEVVLLVGSVSVSVAHRDWKWWWGRGRGGGKGGLGGFGEGSKLCGDRLGRMC